MDETRIANKVELRGAAASRPVFSHESRGERFYQFTLEVERLSGALDSLTVIAREAFLTALELDYQGKVYVLGELRSFNNKSGEGSKLVISVFARELRLEDGEDINSAELCGTLCKPTNLRTTPMGREICDLMLAVNRKYGRSDYLPCIAWGQRARDASAWGVGSRVWIRGRIQSRRYIKNLDGEAVEKTAFEVSVVEIAPDEEEITDNN
jgi:primosomal replication protein N